MKNFKRAMLGTIVLLVVGMFTSVVKAEEMANDALSNYVLEVSESAFFIESDKYEFSDKIQMTETVSAMKKSKKGRFYRYKYLKESSEEPKKETYEYSKWQYGLNPERMHAPSVKVIKKKNKIFEIFEQSRQKIYNYDVVQGGCTDGKYAYYVLLNKNNNMAKISKIRLSDFKVTGVSQSMFIGHGNGMTYDSKRKKLVIAEGTEYCKKIYTVSPATLKKTGSYTIRFPKNFQEVKGKGGVSNIGYCKVTDRYVGRIKGTGNFAVLNSKFQVIDIVKASKKSEGRLPQDLMVVNEHIVQAFSAGGGHDENIWRVYRNDGKHVYTIVIKKDYEIENLFVAGDQAYATFYRSFYKPFQRKVRKGRRVVSETYYRFWRANYSYKVNGI